MSGEIYAIVFKGAIVEGFTADAVKSQLAKLLKTDIEKTAALFSGKQIVLKKTTDRAEATRYGKALRKVGADVGIRVVKAASRNTGHVPAFHTADQPPTQQLTAEALSSEVSVSELPESERTASKSAAAERAVSEVLVVDTSGITLALNEGDLFDPVPKVASPEIDLSRLSVAENDGTPLVEPADPIVITMDLSEFSIKDNDGTALVEHPDQHISKVAVPDFSLDAPGALLETLPKEKARLHPSTTGITLAIAGAALLANEPPQPPAPAAPDTSNINLAPNIDV
ncbi:MAG: hypothetical protein HOI67_04780 [Gammaproteobacteria bacterium]|jgi:hypothetical protein|nr:hypothetical protein [Gammaproteobacteria bacterium]